MKKRLKITLYCLFTIAIILVVRLMLGNIKTNTETVNNTNTENTTGENIDETQNTLNTQDSTFEEDVMKDLEGFFNNNNGYEDIEGEYGFINADEKE